MRELKTEDGTLAVAAAIHDLVFFKVDTNLPEERPCIQLIKARWTVTNYEERRVPIPSCWEIW